MLFLHEKADIKTPFLHEKADIAVFSLELFARKFFWG